MSNNSFQHDSNGDEPVTPTLGKVNTRLVGLVVVLISSVLAFLATML